MIKEIRKDTYNNVMYQMFCDKCNKLYEHYSGENVTEWYTKPGGFVDNAINNGWKINKESSSNNEIICNNCNKIELNFSNETLMSYLIKNCKEIIKEDKTPQIGPPVKIHLYTLNDIKIMMYITTLTGKQSILYFNNRLGHLIKYSDYNQNKIDFIAATGFNLGGLESTSVFENSANINDDSYSIRHYLNYFL